MLMYLELGLLLLCILIGARLGGIGIGAVSGIGLLLFVFIFRMPPGGPPGTVLGMIIAVITALATMEASGGMDFLVGAAGRLLSRHPRQVTFLAPLVTYLLVFAAGTQHVIYAILPVIAEVSRTAGIRPERPLSASVVASQCGVIASPIAAATVALQGLLVSVNLTLPQIMIVVIPSTLLGMALGTLSVSFRGKELADDTEYQRRLNNGLITPPRNYLKRGDVGNRAAIGSCLVFLAAVLFIVLIGMFPDVRPVYTQTVEELTETGQVEVGRAIMIVMLAAAGVIMLVFKADAGVAVKGSVMKGGVTAIISILGVSWLGSSFFEGNRVQIVNGISSLVQSYPWVFAAGMFVLSVLLFSRAATVVTLVPVGLALGLPPHVLVGAFTAANGTFFLPTYGTVLAAVSFDQTGTTRIGRFLFDHSFMRPGLVATATATATAMLLSTWLLP